MFDQYLKRKWVDQETFNKIMAKFVDETLRLLRINQLVIIPTLSSLQMDAWTLVLENKLYIVDAIQISSNRRLEANYFCSGDKYVTDVASGLDIEVYTPENETTLPQKIKDEIS